MATGVLGHQQVKIVKDIHVNVDQQAAETPGPPRTTWRAARAGSAATFASRTIVVPRSRMTRRSAAVVLPAAKRATWSAESSGDRGPVSDIAGIVPGRPRGAPHPSIKGPVLGRIGRVQVGV
jgi:hypothetical protein